MKHPITPVATLAFAAPALAQDDSALQLQWVTRAQFAGSYGAFVTGF